MSGAASDGPAATPGAPVPDGSAPASGSAPGERAPWGFVVIVGLAVLYLALRLVQMAGWLIDWLF